MLLKHRLLCIIRKEVQHALSVCSELDLDNRGSHLVLFGQKNLDGNGSLVGQSREGSLKLCGISIDRYFERYSGVAAFIEKTKKQAYENGYVRTAMGHIRYIPEIRSANKTIRSMAERVAVNTVIQGTAAEIMKKAMIAMAAELKKRNLKSRMLLQVHDELIFEVPEEEIEEMKALVRSCMENAMTLSVPLKVGLETAARWGEMH